MKVLVTGATGFIGSHFVERALSLGHRAVALVRPKAGPASRREDALRERGAEVVTGELRDVAAWQASLNGVDCICHFAAAFREAGVDDDTFRRVNVEGTRELATAAAKAGVKRFVLCGTAGVYGQRVPGIVDERSPMRPWNIYEITKVEAEQSLRDAAAAHDMEYAIVRPSTVYGPGDERLLKMFRAAAKGRFPLFGPGHGRRHMVHVHDLVAAFVAACEAPSAAGAEVIAAGPRATRLCDLLAALAKVLGRESCGPRLPLAPMQMLAAITEDVCRVVRVSPPLYRRRMDFYVNDVEYDCSRARELLGWTPAIDVEEGLAITLDGYRRAGLM